MINTMFFGIILASCNVLTGHMPGSNNELYQQKKALRSTLTLGLPALPQTTQKWTQKSLMPVAFLLFLHFTLPHAHIIPPPVSATAQLLLVLQLLWEHLHHLWIGRNKHGFTEKESGRWRRKCCRKDINLIVFLNTCFVEFGAIFFFFCFAPPKDKV